MTDPASPADLRDDVRSLAEPVGSSAVDAAGRLWALGATSGDLTWFDGGDRGTRRQAVPEPARAELVVVDGAVAVVEIGERRVRSVDDGGGLGHGSCLDVDPTDADRLAVDLRRSHQHVDMARAVAARAQLGRAGHLHRRADRVPGIGAGQHVARHRRRRPARG